MGIIVVFDLDDTLYLERDFVWSGFKAAGSWFHERTGIVGLEATCRNLFDSGQRSQIFDDAIQLLASSTGQNVVEELVNIYRTHKPSIRLAEDAMRYFELHGGKWQHGLLTDGFLATQRAKISALHIERFIDCIVCTGEWGREFWKPHSRGYIAHENHFGAKDHEFVYVADNPAKDFVTARIRGWKTIQIARPDRIHLELVIKAGHGADQVIDTLDRLPACLATY